MHTHDVIDSDLNYTVNASTRTITGGTPNKKLIQHDHNSERITFEIPRYVDEHDMSLCNKVEIHFVNIGDDGEESKGVYLIDDLRVSNTDNSIVTCSWLISAEATKHAGVLSFLIRLACKEGEAIVYAWNTDTYKGITVTKGMNNGEPTVDEYSFDVGRRAEWSEFWDFVQQNGTRTNYEEAFTGLKSMWGGVNIKPKYDMHCTNANRMFYGYRETDTKFSLVEILKKQGVVLDTSQATDMYSMFGFSRVITEIPTIDASNAQTSMGLFSNCLSLETIEKLIVSETTILTDCFTACAKLKNLTIEGTIGQNGLNVQKCPLTHDSLMSIINTLADKSGDTSESWIVTLGATNKAKLTPEEVSIATLKNWQVL